MMVPRGGDSSFTPLSFPQTGHAPGCCVLGSHEPSRYLQKEFTACLGQREGVLQKLMISFLTGDPKVLLIIMIIKVIC